MSHLYVEIPKGITNDARDPTAEELADSNARLQAITAARAAIADAVNRLEALKLACPHTVFKATPTHLYTVIQCAACGKDMGYA